MALTLPAQSSWQYAGWNPSNRNLNSSFDHSIRSKCSQLENLLLSSSNLHCGSRSHATTKPSSIASILPRKLPPLSQGPSLESIPSNPANWIQQSSVIAFAQAADQSGSATALTNSGSSSFQAELDAAVAVVERACRLCLNVRAGIHDDGDLDEGDARLKKQDATPVTVADFGVQALVSLELRRLFPGVPMLGEEDATQLRDQLRSQASPAGTLADAVATAVATVAPEGLGQITVDRVLDAIDDSRSETTSQRRFWILDPIDGTRGFLHGGESQYVIALALVDGGEVVLGVCGCPNMSAASLNCGSCAPEASGGPVEEPSTRQSLENQGEDGSTFGQRGLFDTDERGIIVYASRGQGTWVRGLADIDPPSTSQGEVLDASKGVGGGAVSHSDGRQPQRVRVDSVKRLWDARFCISDHETWGELPLAAALASTPHPEDSDDEGGHLHDVREWEVKQLPLCCGSICKYVAVALGAASVFVQHPVPKPTLKVWDHAAALICVTEAGGLVTDFEGRLLRLGTGESEFAPGGGGVIVTNGRLHRATLEAVRTGQTLLDSSDK